MRLHCHIVRVILPGTKVERIEINYLLERLIKIDLSNGANVKKQTNFVTSSLYFPVSNTSNKFMCNLKRTKISICI